MNFKLWYKISKQGFNMKELFFLMQCDHKEHTAGCNI